MSMKIKEAVVLQEPFVTLRLSIPNKKDKEEDAGTFCGVLLKIFIHIALLVSLIVLGTNLYDVYRYYRCCSDMESKGIRVNPELKAKKVPVAAAPATSVSTTVTPAATSSK